MSEQGGKSPEKGLQQPAVRFPDFVEHGQFDERPGLAMQVRFAKTLVNLIGQDKMTPDTFKSLLRPFSLGFTSHEGEEPTTYVQDRLVRASTERLVNVMALVATDGNAEKAKELIGDHEHSGYADNSHFVDRVQHMLDSDKRSGQ